MNKKKEILILIAGLLSIIATVAFVVTVAIFRAWFYMTIVIAVFFIFQILLAFYLLNSRRIVNVKMCWIFVILSLPVFGFLLFVLFDKSGLVV